jgi:hypothetical protein
MDVARRALMVEMQPLRSCRVEPNRLRLLSRDPGKSSSVSVEAEKSVTSDLGEYNGSSSCSSGAQRS